nr:M28 family peptidase [Pseudobdellovibrionaceae bacterium]
PQSKESIVIGAHGDHLGRGDVGNSLAKNNEVGQIHYGADDNASGVAGVLELAHFYSQKMKVAPLTIKKRIHFAVWSGEELGNLGSSHFLKKHSKFKPEAYINMDMIGRYKQNIYIQGVGSANEWRGLVEKLALNSPLSISVESDPYLPTDSMSFYLAGVPTVSFFTGSHGEYHSPRDTPDLVNFEKTSDIIELVKNLSEELAGSSQRVVQYKKVATEERKLQGRGFRVYLGTVPDYTQEGVRGVRISGTSEGSPAHKSGLKEKDIIIEFNKLKIENMYDLVYALQAALPSKPTTIKVLRENKEQEFQIVPMLKE